MAPDLKIRAGARREQCPLMKRSWYARESDFDPSARRKY
jgi:hypothetical protein